MFSCSFQNLFSRSFFQKLNVFCWQFSKLVFMISLEKNAFLRTNQKDVFISSKTTALKNRYKNVVDAFVFDYSGQKNIPQN